MVRVIKSIEDSLKIIVFSCILRIPLIGDIEKKGEHFFEVHIECVFILLWEFHYIPILILDMAFTWSPRSHPP
jgi:hypothetical protein